MEYMLDTNAFRKRGLLVVLQNAGCTIQISAIVEMEQFYHAVLRKKASVWERIQRDLAIQTVSVTKAGARLAAVYAQSFVSDPRGASHFFRDCLIAASATRHRTPLVTADTKGFTYLNAGRVLTPEECITQLNEKIT